MSVFKSGDGHVNDKRNENIESMKERLKSLFTEDARLKGLAFNPLPTDIIIVTSPKSGTTWLQQIVHQLRSGGDMSFHDISEVVPMIELAYALNIDLKSEQRGFQPRCFHSHLSFEHSPKGCKYIVVWREPCSVFYSFYNFFKDWMFKAEEITLDEFVQEFLLSQAEATSLLEDPSYFHHLLSWWRRQNDPNILFLFYEDMKADLKKAIETVASFMAIDDASCIERAVEMSSFEFMKAHSSKFQIHLATAFSNKEFITSKVIPHRVHLGSTTKAQEVMSAQLKEAIQQKWNDVITKETGLKNYNELRMTFRKTL